MTLRIAPLVDTPREEGVVPTQYPLSGRSALAARGQRTDALRGA